MSVDTLKANGGGREWVEGALYAALGYCVGLIGGLIAALVSAIAIGGIFSGVTAFVFDTWISYTGGPAVNGPGPALTLRFDVAKNALFAGGAFAATFAFCTACLRLFPNRGQIHSIVFLELVSLPALFAIAGDTLNTNGYFLGLIGCAVLLSIALLVFRFPHWIYLTDVQTGE